MKKFIALTGVTFLMFSCVSEEEKEELKLTACDCKDISQEISTLASGGSNYAEIKEEIGEEKFKICSEMFKDKDYISKIKECE